MWKNGSTPNETSSRVCARCGWDCICSRFDRRLPWLSMAAFGEPAVPLVNMSTARSSSSRSTMGTGSDRRRSSRWSEPSISVSDDEQMMWRSEGTWSRSMVSNERRPVGPTKTATASMSASSRVELGPGLDGLSGTATAPTPITAR